jgi:hypothetical protein
MDEKQYVAIVAAAVALRWAAEDLVTARTCFMAAGLTDQADWLVELATRLAGMAHDIAPLPTEDDNR